jgi:outer membrane protein assembly factor BamE (lipoprotein component of BamABCDE complex)
MRYVLALLILLGGCGSSERFDSHRWRNADLDTRERSNMVGSLIKARRLDGMDRDSVVALLGEPTPTDKWDGSEMIYVLGPDGSMFPIDNEWLLIELDQQGRVAGYQVRPD